MLGKHETYHSHNWLSIFVCHLQNGWHRRLIRHHSARDPIWEKEDFEIRHLFQLKDYKVFSAAKYRRSPLEMLLCRHFPLVEPIIEPEGARARLIGCHWAIDRLPQLAE